MNIEKPIPLLEEILTQWQGVIGSEYEGYKNHVYRMIHFCFAMRTYNTEEYNKIIIAGAFHDLGIWIENTVDYIPPSIPPARAYLENRKLEAWFPEIELMITEHHKITPYAGYSELVEFFRKADLVDFSWGLFAFDVPPSYIQEVQDAFPNADFHLNLAKRAGLWFVQHPFNPAPMMKW